jgi:hypothetical protein
MFESNSRYITRGVKQEIPLFLQLFMWNCIETLKEQGKELDYLQVFELTREGGEGISLQSIEHRQEVPEYKKKFVIPCEEPINAKIFIIDGGADYCTMLLAEEY